MKKYKVLYGLLIGLFFGVLITSVVLDAGREKACPRNVCLDKSEVVPVTDRGYFDALHKELSAARKTIHIVCFELKHYPTYGNRSSQNILLDDLVAARDRGVDVKILVDEFGGESGYEYLRKKGIDVRFDSNDTTTHSKVAVIDGRIVLLGSTNFSYFSLEKNNEANLLVRSVGIAGYYEEYFRRLWEKEE